MPDKTPKTESKELELPQNEENDNLGKLPVPSELLDKLPPEARAIFLALSQQTSKTTIGFPTNPLNEKITSEHIGKIIDSTEKDSERDFELNKLEIQDQKISRLYFLGGLIIVLIFVGFVIVYLSNIDKETMRFVLALIVGLVGGFGIKELLPKSKKKSD